MGGIVQPVISDQKPPLDAYRLNIIIEAESKNKGGGNDRTALPNMLSDEFPMVNNSDEIDAMADWNGRL